MRNTDIDSLLFSVEMVDIFFTTSDGKTQRVDTHKAVVDPRSGLSLGVVSNGYRLVQNQEALQFAERCAAQLFGVEQGQLEIFNVHSPRRPWYCQVDLIHKGYEVNVWKQEVYLPFLRVTNSYNGSRALRFDIGYCRELCSNGMIFEKEAIQFRFPHSYASIGRAIDFKIAEGQLKALHTRLASDLDQLHAYNVPEGMDLPLFFRVLSLPHAAFDENMKTRRRTYIGDLVHHASSLTKKYSDEFGPNAYALFNAATDFASNPPTISDMRAPIHSLQTRARTWCQEFVAELANKDKPFDLTEYLGDYGQMANWRNNGVVRSSTWL